MAGDWLKFEKATLEKPEVFQMAAILGLDPDAVIGKLLRVWNWFDDQSRDGHASVTVLSLLDRYSGVTGFVDAMEKVGWITQTSECLILPNFDRHNGSPAKSRALGTKRKQKSRERHGDSVTDAGQKRDKRVTREENRREEKKYTPTPLEIRIGKLLNRRETTAMSKKERDALKEIGEPPEDELQLLEEFYNATIPAEKDFRRTTIQVLLNNWNGEVDKARLYSLQKP